MAGWSVGWLNGVITPTQRSFATAWANKLYDGEPSMRLDRHVGLSGLLSLRNQFESAPVIVFNL